MHELSSLCNYKSTRGSRTQFLVFFTFKFNFYFRKATFLHCFVTKIQRKTAYGFASTKVREMKDCVGCRGLSDSMVWKTDPGRRGK